MKTECTEKPLLCTLPKKSLCVMLTDQRFYYAEEQPCHQQREADVESLRSEECIDHIAILLRYDVFESCIHADADEC